MKLTFKHFSIQFIFALSTILYVSSATADDCKIVVSGSDMMRFDTKEIISKDWDTYKIIGFENIPDINTNIIDKKGFSYLGVGEVVAGPTGAAISNAIHEALGQRIKTMPFTKENITKELLN